jgi:hypothetical protein
VILALPNSRKLWSSLASTVQVAIA